MTFSLWRHSPTPSFHFSPRENVISKNISFSAVVGVQHGLGVFTEKGKNQSKPSLNSMATSET